MGSKTLVVCDPFVVLVSFACLGHTLEMLEGTKHPF